MIQRPIGHIPFAGHRSCAEWLSQSRSLSPEGARQDGVSEHDDASSALSDARPSHFATVTDGAQQDHA